MDLTPHDPVAIPHGDLVRDPPLLWAVHQGLGVMKDREGLQRRAKHEDLPLGLHELGERRAGAQRVIQGWSADTHAARAPTATIRITWAELAFAPGHVRMRSGSRPISWSASDVPESNGGSSARYASCHSRGQALRCQGSSSHPAYAIRVPSGPITSSSASITVCDPPTTHPKALTRACTMRIAPARTPIA
jgi:hypothetical protein